MEQFGPIDILQSNLNEIRSRTILALDLNDLGEVKQLLAKFDLGSVNFVKVGMQLFYKEGPSIIKFLKDKGFRIFLDLKMHDIPNTVVSAVKSLSTLGVDILNVHALGGYELMKQCACIPNRPIIIGVTELTSTSKQMMNEEMRIPGLIEEQVLHQAILVERSGLDGVVASALELPKLKRELRSDFICLIPGIRLDGPAGDQHRIATPKEAFEMGASFIVIGREVRCHNDPSAQFERIINSVLQKSKS